MKNIIVQLIGLLLLLMMAVPLDAIAEPMPIVVSIAPQKYFVQQIGKERVQVEVMVSPGANPATYEPKPRQMATLSKTKLYLAVGVPFEKAWLHKIAAANPKMKVVHTDAGIQKIPMPRHDHHDEAAAHEHQDGEHKAHTEPHHKHEDRGLDPHIWLSPTLVKIQTRTIVTALAELDPAHALEYQANHDRFIDAVDRLDARLKSIFTGHQGMRFMVFHPSWGYFARDYGLQQLPIEVEGKDPKPAQLKALIQEARQRGIRVIFVQPQFSSRSAKLVAREIDGQVAYADPLAEDWMINLEEVAATFQGALK